MKKSEFTQTLAKQINHSQKETGKIITQFNELLTKTLKQGDVVGLDIGKFQLRQRQARTAVNPSNGKKIQVPARVVPIFKPSKRFKEAVLQ